MMSWICPQCNAGQSDTDSENIRITKCRCGYDRSPEEKDTMQEPLDRAIDLTQSSDVNVKHDETKHTASSRQPRFKKSYIRILGFGNLIACSIWFFVSTFIGPGGSWVEIDKLLRGLAQSISSGSQALEQILIMVASVLSVTIYLGWVCFLPSALIMIFIGYYPRFLKQLVLIKPVLNSDTLVSRELKLDEHMIDDQN